MTLRVTVRGKAAHVGLHYDGENAFAAAVDVALSLRGLERALRKRLSALTFSSADRRARESIMLVGGLAAGGTSFNIVPDEFSFTVDRRPNADESYDDARRELLAILESARADGVDLSWDVLQDAGSAMTSPESDFVQAVSGAAAAVTGSAPSVTCCPGVLETRVYSRLGIPAVAFGPGLIDRMHSPDEDVPVANLFDAARIYTRVAAALT